MQTPEIQNDNQENPLPHRRRVYGRRIARPLRHDRQKAVDEYLPTYHITPEAAKALDFSHDTWLEIGFGSGEHMIWQAEQNPLVRFIGCEPFVNGVSACALDTHKAGLTNIHIWPDDARPMIEALPEQSISRIFVLHPDPWPKKRHHKRRFIQQETLTIFHRILKQGGILRMASDHPGVAEWMLEQTTHHGGFEWMAENAADWRNRPHDWPQTRYEKKGLAAGRAPYFMEFKKRL